MRLRLQTRDVVIERNEMVAGAPAAFLSRKEVRDAILEALSHFGGPVVLWNLEEPYATENPTT